MSDSTLHELSYVAEATFGTTPATPTLTKWRHNSCTLGEGRTAINSEELRVTRQMRDVRHGVRNVTGEVVSEFIPGGHDSLLEAVLMGTFANKFTKSSTAVVVATSDDSYTVTAGFFTGIEIGDKVTVSGFAVSANNGIKTVTANTGTKLSVSENLTDGETGENITFTTASNQSVSVGRTRRSFTCQRYFADLDTASAATTLPYHVITGVELNTFAIACKTDAIVMATYGAIGKAYTPQQLIVTGGTYAAANTSGTFNSLSGSIVIDDVSSVIVTELSFNVSNGMTPRYGVGSALAQAAPSIARAEVTGTLTAYFESSAILNQFLTEGFHYLKYKIVDGDGKYYRFHFPRFKFTGGQPNTSGQGAITLQLPFTATEDDNGKNFIIERCLTP